MAGIQSLAAPALAGLAGSESLAAAGAAWAIEQIDEAAWNTLADYPATSIAQIAETHFGERRQDRPPRPHA